MKHHINILRFVQIAKNLHTGGKMINKKTQGKKNEMEVEIDSYKISFCGFAFLGTCLLLISVMFLDYIKTIWGVLIIIVGWFIWQRLTELEVNRWLRRKAKIYIR